jgi:D-threonate/D-erythronate kinase
MLTISSREPSLRLGMIADDLTGACDAGVQFAQRGFSTLVQIAPGAAERLPSDLLVLTTNSRDDAPTVAAAKVRNACRALHNEGREVIFKKIDSTLRGNLGAELQAALIACECSLALVAPAFPALGRTLEDGVLHVAGSESREAIALPALLAQQGLPCVAHFARPASAGGCGAPIKQMRLLPAGTAVVFDATCDEDLQAVARAGMHIETKILLAGSAGLAAATAKVIEASSPGDSRNGAPGASGALGSVLLAIGSTHPLTQAQVNYLLKNRIAACLEPAPDFAHQASRFIKEGKPLLVVLQPEAGNQNQFAPLLAALKDHGVRGLALSGGDTAFAILSAAGATGIKLVSEVVPGIPFGRLWGGPADGLPVVTKAGGFGAENALAVIADFLARQARTG